MLLTAEKLYTAEDYQRLPEGAPYQLIEGELIMSPTPTNLHQDIVGNLFLKLQPFVLRNKLGKFVLSPMDVHLTEIDVFQPDLIFIRAENVHKRRPNDRIRFAPDLVVEILSPSTANYDYKRKKEIYCQSGVREYWIVDPDAETIEIMVNESGQYRTDAFLRKPGVLESAMFPGFSMMVEDVFEF
jgi:Uma2 family endonuclease